MGLPFTHPPSPNHTMLTDLAHPPTHPSTHLQQETMAAASAGDLGAREAVEAKLNGQLYPGLNTEVLKVSGWVGGWVVEIKQRAK